MSRKLRPDELDLWRKVAERTERLDLGFRPESVGLEPQVITAPKRKKLIETLVQQDRRKSQPSTRVIRQPSVSDDLRSAPLQMDRKAFDQMKRGKIRPEGRIDLHGMTLDRAHPALTRFILSAHSSGKRLVLVITGKGKSRDDGGPIPVRFGVLRHQVPQWLGMQPLSSAVMQITQAHDRHGGGGAYYVYLRKPR
ncbi:Endonuclease MutS2 [Ascidiaceihabitans donghaensis]|uniref:Endonuclease MutS2 n=2 Tax=Ascidiaceihabitans donghaensis TaxID=1510460 RepID=A0A2R8B8K2_9RHOB|nr:Endonuclease MutS2 [Ascidiaceihabitans donghaensis]